MITKDRKTTKELETIIVVKIVKHLSMKETKTNNVNTERLWIEDKGRKKDISRARIAKVKATRVIQKNLISNKLKKLK